ncbi:MAG TPA: ATP-binding protein [Thermoanaerobaculia bacterium]|nr:ATP-binding protein [Thermoanaerobaculia bacterium]
MSRVLVVDDSAEDRRELRALLSRHPDMAVEVEEVEDADSALDRLRAVGGDHVDLIVTELVSSREEGLGLIREVREEFPSVPVVLVTSRGSDELVVEALRAGAASYVPKHLLAQYLEDVVHTLLEQAESRRKRSRALQSLVDSRSIFELDNDRRLFGPLIGYLRETLAGLGRWDESGLMHIAVALEEALVNAAEHGNLELDSDLRDEDRDAYFRLADERRDDPHYGGRRVRLEVNLSRQEARFVIADEGQGFDPGNLPDPTDADNLLRPSGRGVLLMRALMDEVVFNDQGNEVLLVKRG